MSTSDGKMERELLREVFAEVFPARPTKSFGAVSRRVVGVHDGAEGVQWNTGTNLVEGQWTDYSLGVNLEGIEYGGRRPLWDLIRLERENLRILEAIGKLRQPHQVEVTLARDAWALGGPPAPRGRPLYYLDRFVLPRIPDKLTQESWRTALPIDKLTKEEWLRALTIAQQCYHADGEPDHRSITFYDKRGEPEARPRPQLYEITSHLNFRTALGLDVPITWDTLVAAERNARNQGKTLGETWLEGRNALVEAMRGACDRLQPLYKCVWEQSV